MTLYSTPTSSGNWGDMAINEEGEEKEISGWYATEDGHTTSVTLIG